MERICELYESQKAPNKNGCCGECNNYNHKEEQCSAKQLLIEWIKKQEAQQ
jgi:hypothetical protein